MAEQYRIGFAASGGGVRALIFHLGVLDRLAEANRLEDIHYISSVSGGSLAIGLIMSLSGMKWPSSSEYRTKTLPALRALLTSRDLQKKFTRATLLNPKNWSFNRARVLADCLEREWGVVSNLDALPESPRWSINATCYETGKNWRFQRDKMGDFVAGYVENPNLRLSAALAASAGFPGLVGPLVLATEKFTWKNYGPDRSNLVAATPILPELHLWDGGVHDNLGLEALHKPYKGYLKNINFLIVSDASAPTGVEKSRWGAYLRLIYIAQEQIRGLRSRIVVDEFNRNPRTGVYFRLGNSAKTIAEKSGATFEEESFLDDALIKRAKEFKTALRKISPKDFDLLKDHGREVADCTMKAYLDSSFLSGT